jgi:hypothetical protein
MGPFFRKEDAMLRRRFFIYKDDISYRIKPLFAFFNVRSMLTFKQVLLIIFKRIKKHVSIVDKSINFI